MSIKRIYVNSYLAYVNDGGESLSQFIADFPQSINNPKDVSVMSTSLLFYPTYPNFTPNESKVYLSALIGETTYNITIQIPTTYVYSGPSDPNSVGFSNVQEELNNDANILSIPDLPAGLNTDVGEFVYLDDDQNFSFVPVDGVTVTFQNGADDAYRRIGLRRTLIDVAQTAAFVFLNPPILARTQVIYLCSNISSDSMVNTRTTGYGANIMLQIPVLNPAFGSIINFIPPFNWGKLAYPRSFQEVQFTLLDDQFLPITFATNANLLMGFEITYDEALENKTENLLRMPANYSVSYI